MTTRRVLALSVVGVALAVLGRHLLVDRRAAAASPQRQAMPATADRRVRAEGRLVTYPDAQVAVRSELAGTIARMPVRERTVVRKGDLVVQLDDAEQRWALAEARAKLAEMNARARFLTGEVRRQESLFEQAAISRQTLEGTRSDLEAAHARVALAEATVQRLSAILKKMRIVAPIDGVVIERLPSQGEMIVAGALLVTVADLRRTRVEAEVDEFDIGRVSVGLPATITAEGFTGTSWPGCVEEIPDAVEARRLRPQDPGKPTDARVLLVKIALAEPTRLSLGQRLEVHFGSGEGQCRLSAWQETSRRGSPGADAGSRGRRPETSSAAGSARLPGTAGTSAGPRASGW